MVVVMVPWRKVAFVHGLYKEVLPDGMVFGITSALIKVYNFI